MYNILGYPYYPNVLKEGDRGRTRGRSGTDGEAYGRIDGSGIVKDPRTELDYGAIPGTATLRPSMSRP